MIQTRSVTLGIHLNRFNGSDQQFESSLGNECVCKNVWSVCPYLSLSLPLTSSLPLSLQLCVTLYFYISVFLYISLYISVSLYTSVFLALHPFSVLSSKCSPFPFPFSHRLRAWCDTAQTTAMYSLVIGFLYDPTPNHFVSAAMQKNLSIHVLSSVCSERSHRLVAMRRAAECSCDEITFKRLTLRGKH